MHCCESMEYYINQEDGIVTYVPKFREFGIPVHDGGSSYIVVDYCPWCGSNLPTSLRNEWFDILDNLEMEPDDASIPGEMKSDGWWKKKYGAGAAPREESSNDRAKPSQGERRIGGKRALRFDFEDDNPQEGE